MTKIKSSGSSSCLENEQKENGWDLLARMGVILVVFALIFLLRYLLSPFCGFSPENETDFIGYLQALNKSEQLSRITSFLSGAAMGADPDAGCS